MKQDILKIAGVKSEKELYAKYGTEVEFMAKHGGAFNKAVKKAKMGAAMVNRQLTQLTDFANPPQAQDGWHSEWNDEPIYNEREISISNTSREQKPKAPSSKPATKANVNVSVVDFMNSKGMKSDFNTRKSLAQQYGIKDYKGTAEQNMQLMSNLKGKTSAPKKAEAPKKVEAAASNKPAPVKPKLSKAEEWIAKDPYFFAEESDPEWIKTIDAPFTGIRNLGARTVFDRDPKAFAKLLAMGALGGLGKMIINKTEELYPYNPKQIGGPAPKQISNYTPTPKQIGGRPQPTGWSTESGMRSGQYPIKEDGGYVPQAQGGWHSGWYQDPYDEYTNPVSAEDEYIANMDAMNVAQSPMKQFPINIAGKSAKVKTPLESKDNIFGGVRNIIQGGIQMKDDREKYLRAKQWGTIADLSQKARKDDVAKNKYFRPEDMVFDPNQLSRSYGTGYGILGSAQDGMQIGGNETPIHNMYTNEDTLYSDLGYEPLEESVKQYEDGGGLFSNWKGDLTKFGSQNATTLGGSAGSFIGGGDGRTSGTSTMLGGVGQLAGTAIGGPLGGVIGSLAGSALGGLFSAGQEKRMQEQQDKISTLGGMQNIYNFQGRNSGFMQNGGSIVDYMNANRVAGYDSSKGSRKELYKKLFNDDTFTGEANQNLRLLDYLKHNKVGSNASPAPTKTSKSVAKTPAGKTPATKAKAPISNQPYGPLPSENYGEYNAREFPENRNLESGVVVDKNTNMAYILQGNKIARSFKVLTGQARDANVNNKGVAYLENHPESRATPTGSYFMNPSKDIYGVPGFGLIPIEAFNEPAPKARSLAEHLTYNPAVRDKYYDMPGNKRNRSYGCVNCKKPDISQLTSMFPKGDTTMVIDTRKPLDQSFMSKLQSKEDGGWVSHDWQPQTITKFGDYDVKDLLKDDPTMDTLRYGGTMHHPKNPTQRALQTYDMGGELEVDDRGDIDYEGYNPVTAASGANGYIGITRGPSHDNGGFNLSYGGNEIEAEGNETIMEKADDGASINPETGQPESNLIILGDMKTLDGGQFVGQTANKNTLKKITKGKDIKDMKFKHLGNNIAKLTGNLNKKEDRYLKMLDSDDELTKTSARVSWEAVQNEYDDLHNIQNDLMNLQESYHSAAKEHGYDDTPEFLKDLKNNSLSGNMAKFGGKFTKAEDGAKLSDVKLKEMYDKAKAQGRGKAVADFQRAFHDKYPDAAKQILREFNVTNLGKSKGLDKSDLNSNVDEYFGPRTELYKKTLDRMGITNPISPIAMNRKNVTPTPPNITAKVPDMSTVKAVVPPKDGMKFSDIYNMFSQYTRPYIKNPLDPRQLAGEMYGLASNQLEGVKAQGYQPYLETPYSVSFQDQMNANQSDFNAMQRQLGGDPASLSTLAAQKYAANSGVLGQQFRANQEMQMGAYNRNRATLNDAAIKNLAIYDQQADKQSRARSITKAQDYEYLRSIGDKFARARSEELAANVQANMFPDYTFGPKGRIYNTGIANFDIPQNISSDPEFAKMYSDYLNKKDGKTKDTKVKNGGIVKAYKNL